MIANKNINFSRSGIIRWIQNIWTWYRLICKNNGQNNTDHHNYISHDIDEIQNWSIWTHTNSKKTLIFTAESDKLLNSWFSFSLFNYLNFFGSSAKIGVIWMIQKNLVHASLPVLFWFVNIWSGLKKILTCSLTYSAQLLYRSAVQHKWISPDEGWAIEIFSKQSSE